jgi:hypothetical protein
MIFITALAIFKNTVYVCPANPLQRQTALIRTGSIIYSVIPLYNYCFSNSCLTAHKLFIRYRSTSIHYPLQENRQLQSRGSRHSYYEAFVTNP